VPAAAPARAKPLLDKRGNVYQPAIGPRLKILLALIFASVAVLGATGAYLAAITFFNWWNKPKDYTNWFYMWMFLVHVAVGVAIAVPFLIFGFTHYFTARTRKNRVAVRLGLALFITGIIVVLTGILLCQKLIPGLPRLPTETTLRAVTYWLHVLVPVVAVWLYVLHRRAGPDIKWSWGLGWGGAVGAFVVFMLFMHSQNPNKWYASGPKEGEKYYFPSEVKTADGNFIRAEALMMDKYCLRCHQDIYNDHYHSAHKFSSFNNPAYLFSVLETREMGLKRDGNVKASRWCAGCHDPVPFLSGKFDDPGYDVFKDPTAHAGITCVVCHAQTNINSTMGNAAYTIDEPPHYPFAYSDSPLLQWVNERLVKAKPDFHKKTFLKPFHKTAEFCSTCHKVSLPLALTHYIEFLRGQNHYDTYLLSGVSGVGARSFYYPPVAKTNCAECHMPYKPSEDFGSKVVDKSGKPKVHNHLFPAANTGLPWLLSRELRKKADPDELRKAAQAHADFLRGVEKDGSDKKLRIDLFGLKEGGTIEGKLIAPLRPELPKLKPGKSYLIEVVIRTVNMGHVFPQGTADSNEIWVDFTARSGGKIIGRSGALRGKEPDTGKVDEWSHFVNVFMLDRQGKRINRRNPQDILVPLYDHQIPPGAGQVVHYKLDVPKGITRPVELEVRLRYRKFDQEYMGLVYGKNSKIPEHTGQGKDGVPRLPIVDMCKDQVTLPVEGMADAGKVLVELRKQESPIPKALRWQRWNDYGIGCFLEGAPGGNRPEGKKPEGELEQAAQAFSVLAYGAAFKDNPAARGNGLINLARVYNDQGQLRKAVAALNEASALNKKLKDKAPVPWWTVAWVGGQVDVRNKHFDRAIDKFEKIIDPKNQPRARKFDFTRDYIVLNALGKALLKRSQDKGLSRAERDRYLGRAVEAYERTLALDSENPDAHKDLQECYSLLGGTLPSGVDAGEVPEANPETLRSLGKAFAAAQASRAERLRAAARLEQVLQEYSTLTLRPDQRKVPALALLRGECRDVYTAAKDARVRAAAALVLSRVHMALHLIYKPDDEAPQIVGKFRERPENRAAAAAADPIVIYPLDRY
jgi:tetratricopeptide (TPR) repeat protein